MSAQNPHGFPDIRDMATGGYSSRRNAAMGQWREAHANASSRATGLRGGGALLADWEEAVEENEAREQAKKAKEAKERADAAREQRRTVEIPNAFLDAGAARRDIRQWLAGGYSETASLVEARDLLANPGTQPFLVLAGAVGTGKTCGVTLALLEHAAKAERWLASDVPCFWNAAAMALGSLLGHAGEEKLAQGCAASVLVIEDLGSEAMVGADVWLAMVGVVLDARYRDEALTIITTNCSMDALRKRYGARVADRLRQCARLKGSDKDSMRKAAP
jgi:DNA replication protein DnaC